MKNQLHQDPNTLRMSENLSTLTNNRWKTLVARTRGRFWAPIREFCISLGLLPYLQIYALVFVSLGAAAWWFTTKSQNFPLLHPRVASETEIDATLQGAAAQALGQREGTIIVMDPQTGRVRAVVNPDLAFADSFSPGSTIKPFVALAALRAGLI